MMCANADATKKCLRWGWDSLLSLQSCTLTLMVHPCWEASGSGEGAGTAPVPEGIFG